MSEETLSSRAPTSTPADPAGVSADLFDRCRRLALQLAGIELFDRHRELIHRRGRRLGIHDAFGLEALVRAAEAGDQDAGSRLIGLITTNFTGFFRHPWHFDIAAEQALWAAHRRGRARLWSAAAATGEEPYSLAMALMELFRRDDPPATILATDIDEEALAVARQGEYAAAAVSPLTREQRTRFFLDAAGTRRWRLVPEVRRLVEFRSLNLVDPAWPVQGPFDVIFCRNVLIYLEMARRQSVLERMASLLMPDGVLILDPVEDVGQAGSLFGHGTNGVYMRRTAPSAPAATGRSNADPLQR